MPFQMQTVPAFFTALSLSWVAGAVTVLLLGLTRLIYNREGTPLRKIPGPFLASLSKLWIVIITRQLNRHEYDRELHQRYGTVVRIGPRDVSVSSPSALKIIYGAGPKAFQKHEYYSVAADPQIGEDGLDLFTERHDMNKYRLQRKLIGPAYSATALKDYEHLLGTAVTDSIARMRQLCGRPFDIDIWFNMWVFDCISVVTFSKTTGLIDRDEVSHSIMAMRQSWFRTHWVGFLPWLHRLLRLATAITTSVFKSESNGAQDFMTVMLLLDARKQGRDPIVKNADIAQRLLDAHTENPVFKAEWVDQMIMTNFSAGVETTALTFSSLIVEIINNPGVQQRIQKEVDTAFAEGRLTNPPNVGDMERELPYLTACLDETTRLHNASGLMLPRVVPEGGVSIDGFFIPSGTGIGINPWVLGRDKSLYGQDADSFRPERWLEMNAETKANLEKYRMHFGTPARSCPGQHLARALLSKSLPVLFLEFEWAFADPGIEPKLLKRGLTKLISNFCHTIYRYYVHMEVEEAMKNLLIK